jgi:hypothetical protein
VLSAFGEHLIQEEIEEAVAAAAQEIDASIVDYCVALVHPKVVGSTGRHHYLIEFASGPVSAERLDALRPSPFPRIYRDGLHRA